MPSRRARTPSWTCAPPSSARSSQWATIGFPSARARCIASLSKRSAAMMEFNRNIRGIIRDFDALPREARDYVAFLEQEIGCPITIVSTGPKRHEICYR